MGGRGRTAERPTEIPGCGWWDILRRVRHTLARDHICVAAAGVAFCTLFAAIPGVAVILACFGLFADPTAVHRHLEMTGGLLHAAVSGFLADQMQALAAASRFHLGSALLVALWSARAGASTLISVFNLAYRERETRSFLHYQTVVSAVTAATCLFGLLAFALIAILPLATGALPLGPEIRTVVYFGRWPALAVLMTLALAAVYRFAPSRSRPKWRWAGVGAVVATALWLIGSAGFSHYVARFASSDETFGALGVIMLLLTWFYLTAFAVLLGAELNAEMERQTGQDTTEGPVRPMGQRGARVADTIRTDG